MPRPRAEELQHCLYGVRGTLEDDLDGSIRRVARRPRDTLALRLPARRVAEEDSLHTAVSDGPPANHGHLGTVDT